MKNGFKKIQQNQVFNQLGTRSRFLVLNFEKAKLCDEKVKPNSKKVGEFFIFASLLQLLGE